MSKSQKRKIKMGVTYVGIFAVSTMVTLLINHTLKTDK